MATGGRFDKQIFCLITGASKGLGQTLAVEFSKMFQRGSNILIIARDIKGLEKTRSLIQDVSPGINVLIQTCDLSNANGETFEQLLNTTCKLEFKEAILVNNAGNLGDISKSAASFTNSAELKSYFELNINSPILLTSVFVSFMKRKNTKTTVINISSLAALQCFNGWSLYCTGKAAREMYFRSLAEDEPDVEVLNYAPGPLSTDMTKEILEKAYPAVKEWFTKAQADGTLLKTEYTASRLISILEARKFKSGAHVDVYDEI